MKAEVKEGQELVAKEKENLAKGKLVTIKLEDMIKAHPLIKGVLSAFTAYVENAEPVKANRPKLKLIVKDEMTGGFQGVMTPRSSPDEAGRVLTVILAVEKNKTIKNLIVQPAKISTTLGIFHEGDPLGERDMALCVEGLLFQVATQLSVIGAITAVNNSFHE